MLQSSTPNYGQQHYIPQQQQTAVIPQQLFYPQQHQVIPQQQYPQFQEPEFTDNDESLAAMTQAFALMTKAFQRYPTQTNNNQRISSNTRYKLIAQPGFNMGNAGQMVGVMGSQQGYATGFHMGNQMGNQNMQNQMGQYAGNQIGQYAGNQMGQIVGNQRVRILVIRQWVIRLEMLQLQFVGIMEM